MKFTVQPDLAAPIALQVSTAKTTQSISGDKVIAGGQKCIFPPTAIPSPSWNKNQKRLGTEKFIKRTSGT